LGTPLPRMHLANASGHGVVESEPVAPALVTVLDPVVSAGPALLAVGAGVLALPEVAPVGLGELPPQPASNTTLRSVATANRRGRGERVSRFGALLPGIWFLVSVVSVCASVLRNGWFQHGFPPRRRQAVRPLRPVIPP
jgi:hypothetical protein